MNSDDLARIRTELDNGMDGCKDEPAPWEVRKEEKRIAQGCQGELADTNERMSSASLQ